jgi:hypothetical protein
MDVKPAIRLRAHCGHPAEFVGHLEADGMAGNGLERLTEPSALVECDEGAGEGREGEMDVRAAFVADGQASESRQPRQRTLDDPAVAAQALTALDPPARNAGHDPAGPAFPTATAVVVGFVGVQLAGPAARASRAA